MINSRMVALTLILITQNERREYIYKILLFMSLVAVVRHHQRWSLVTFIFRIFLAFILVPSEVALSNGNFSNWNSSPDIRALASIFARVGSGEWIKGGKGEACG